MMENNSETGNLFWPTQLLPDRGGGGFRANMNEWNEATTEKNTVPLCL
jgi:hypothetical protein